MIIFDEEKLSAFFDTVSRGFQRSPLEVILVIVAVLAFVTLLIVTATIQRHRSRRQRLKLARRRYRELIENKDLSPSQRNLVERLARYLKDPAKKYLILVNQPTFNYCAARLREKEGSIGGELAELRHRLGFRLHGPEQVPASSTELPEGQGLLIVGLGRQQDLKAQGRITGQEARFLAVRLLPGPVPFREREPVRVYFQNRSGLFSFDSRIQRTEGASLRLDHGEQIKRIQRRRYYRKKISQPVAVRKPGSQDRPEISTFYDLGGNGASLKNPGGRYAAGDDVELTFMAAGERFTLAAEVLRTSRNGETLHVRFAPMREATRDRIIGSLFQGAATARERRS